MRRPALLLLVLLPFLGGADGLGCSTATDGTCACTEEFRTFTLTVLDDAMQPAANVTLTRTNLRTGRVVEPGWLGLVSATDSEWPESQPRLGHLLPAGEPSRAFRDAARSAGRAH